MLPGSVIYDLAAVQGGNTAFTEADKIVEKNRLKIDESSKLLSECICNDKLIHTFGTGHSHVIGLELFVRAGGLANVNSFLDSSESSIIISDISSFNQIFGYKLSSFFALDESPKSSSTSVGLKYLGSTLITISPVSALLPISSIPSPSHIIPLAPLSFHPSSKAHNSINSLTLAFLPVAIT